VVIWRAAATTLGAVAWLTIVVSGQGDLRTPWGDPDLQGTWPSGQLINVPFERPAQFGTRAELTDAEFKQLASGLQRQQDADAEQFSRGGGGGVNPPSHWLEAGRPVRQTSLIVDPPDGRLPPMTEDGARRAKAWPSTNPSVPYASAQEFNIYDRCITRGVLGSTMPNIYSSGIEIMQAPGQVVIRYEMIHETRIIPLDDRPWPPAHIKSWMGTSRGRFEGNTLVVVTRNLNGKTGMQGNGMMLIPSDAIEIIERFTPLSANILQYEVTVNDPKTWTRPWKASFPLRRDSKYQMFEYACHEGNYAMRNTLSGSRADEKTPAR